VALARTTVGRSTACGWPALSREVVVVRAGSGPRWAQTGHDLLFIAVFNIDPWLFLRFVCGMRNSGREVVVSFSAGGGFDGGRSDAQATRWSLGVADPGENLRFRPLPEPVMAMSYAFLKASLKVKLSALSVPSGGNPRSLVIG
jgi:hypothetical protein